MPRLTPEEMEEVIKDYYSEEQTEELFDCIVCNNLFEKREIKGIINFGNKVNFYCGECWKTFKGENLKCK